METFDRMVRALGPPQGLREVRSGSRILAAVGRWRHRGGSIDLSGTQTFQLVFNVSGGQSVELRWGERSVRTSIRAGSIGLVSPGNPTSVAISGEADVLQILLSDDLIEGLTGNSTPLVSPQLTAHEPQLQAAAAQALVALAKDSGESAGELDGIVHKIACRFAQPFVTPAVDTQGGLSPGARRRVQALMDEQLNYEVHAVPTLSDLAAAAGLSVHHFIKAFRRTEGDMPYETVIARRIDHALTLLLRANVRVDQVGDATGFSSPSHFCSAFRTRMGVTPGAFRDAANHS